MNAVNAVALVLYFVQLLAYARTTQQNRDITAKGPMVGIHALASGLFVVCVLGSVGTLPYQLQRDSVTEAARWTEIVAGALSAVVFAVVQFCTWSIVID